MVGTFFAGSYSKQALVIDGLLKEKVFFYFCRNLEGGYLTPCPPIPTALNSMYLLLLYNMSTTDRRDTTLEYGIDVVL